MTVNLRDYQEDVVGEIYNAWQNGTKHVCAVMPTGAGKSVVVSHIALQNYNLNLTQAIVAHRKELVGQMAGHLARQGIRHRIIASTQTISQITASQRVEFGKSFVNPTSSAAVVSIDTLLARSDVMRDWLPQVRTWTIDECFHPATFIETKNGHVTIDTVKVDDLVRSYDEKSAKFVYKKVNRLYKRHVQGQLVSIEVNCGNTILVTQSHPVYTKHCGWVPAGALWATDCLLNDMGEWQEVVTLGMVDYDGPVYNIEVDDTHTYLANGVVVHNCHHCIRTNKWGKLVDLFPNAFGLGVTATPRRADGYGLGAHADGVFGSIILGPSMRELIDMGNLSDYEIVCPESDLIVSDDDFAASGDLSFKKGREASKKSHIVGDVVTNYIRYSVGKQCIVFATDVETSGEIAKNFTNNGVKAVSVSAETDASYRDQVIRDFRSGKIQVLVNVDLFGEGFDVPNVATVIMARPTGSLAVYLQQAGRALRPLVGKSHGIIIDMVSNVKRHGLPDKKHFWSLDRVEKRGKAKMKDPEDIDVVICRSCTRPYLPITRACPHCGSEPPLPDPASRRPETVDGDLTLLTREMLANIRKQAELESPSSVAERVAAAAGTVAAKGAANRQTERIEAQSLLNDTIAQWAGFQRAMGRGDSEIYRRFYIATGTDVATALTLPRADMEKLTEMVKCWNQ